MRFLKDEQGQASILLAVCMVAIVGIAGLAVDVGHLRYAKRELQTLADSAALAGATEITHCDGSDNCDAMQTAVQQSATENGTTLGAFLTQCSGSVSGLTLELNNGPCALGSSDPNSDDANYVETVVTQSEPMYFARILGLRSMTITARAEAKLGNSPFCVMAKHMTLNSGSHLTASCGVVSNGCIASNNINGAHVTSTQFDIDCSSLPNNTNNLNPQPTLISTPVPDPLAWVTNDNSWSLPSCYNSCYNTSTNSNTLLYSGLTYGGVNVNSGTLTLSPGTYYFTGNLIVNSGASLQGTGVTIYFTSGATMMANSGSSVSLTAPTNGSLAGILFYQDPSDTAQMILDSGSGGVYQGAVYLPQGSLDFNSGAQATAYTIIDVNSLTIDSGGQLNDDYSSLANGSPAKSTTGTLVE